jgi:hypothetical protein
VAEPLAVGCVESSARERRFLAALRQQQQQQRRHDSRHTTQAGVVASPQQHPLIHLPRCEQVFRHQAGHLSNSTALQRLAFLRPGRGGSFLPQSVDDTSASLHCNSNRTVVALRAARLPALHAHHLRARHY